MKTFLGMIGTLLIVHLALLFGFHFNERFSARDFQHGFDKRYTQKVKGLDTSDLDAILLQPFTYLGQGKQMTAFTSKDGKYVLKLFNPMRPQRSQWYRHWKYWQRYSSIKWFSREWFGKKGRLQKLFFRHRLAFEKLQKETGLIYVHLRPSREITHYVHLTNKQGKKSILPLEKTPFVLQERAELVPAVVKREGLEKVKDALETLFARRIEEGITDRIQTLGNNYGFIGERAIQIDFGRIHYVPEMKKDQELARILQALNNSLSEYL